MLGLLSAESEQMEIKGGDAGQDTEVSQYGFTSSKVVPLDTVLSHKFSSNSREVRNGMLSWAVLSLCKTQGKCSETGFGVSLKGNVWRCFPRDVSYCCNIPEAKDVSFT